MQQLILIMLFGYLIGSVPTGKILGLTRGIDIQKHGTGNIGFANSVRVLGWRLGLVVLAVDTSKAALSVYIATNYLSYLQAMLVGLSVVLGNIFPVWLRFRGGKGVATGLGVLLVLSPFIAAVGLVCYAIAFYITRISGKSSVIGMISLPISSLIFEPSVFWFCCCLTIIGILTHINYFLGMFKQVPKKHG